MLLHFNIHYFPNHGEVLMLNGSAPETGSLQEDKALEMQYLGDGFWHLPICISGSATLEYRYFVRENGQTKRREWGENHRVELPKKTNQCTLYDFWQPEPDMPFLYTSAYTESLMAIEKKGKKTKYESDHVIIKVQAPIVKSGQSVGISGNIELFGEWKEDRALKMQFDRFPEWSISLDAKTLPETCNYKFVVIDNLTGKIVGWEWGEPRNLYTPRGLERQMLMHSGMLYHFQEAPWKGTGVAIPVFSLRSEDSWGCGDFADLKKMIDWAKLTGQQMIQLLPINDTTLTGTWRDSYPYNAISIFALHPIYISINKLHSLKSKKAMEGYEKERLELNALPEVDYEKVLQLKWRYLQDLFSQEGATVLQTEDYNTFYEKNRDWLIPYAAFCYLRKSQDSYDFNDWDTYANYDSDKIDELCNPKHAWYKDISIHFYIQYQLHLQLSAARDYAHKHSVILKGDIPIGISRKSIGAWKDPHLFNMDAQVGAPPDDFSIKGQNWGFPSYNWERMQAEDLVWWKHRFQKMADYFDAYRIDHILGFFRIWEMPLHSVEGLLGHFSPALPLSIEEMYSYGFFFDEKTMTTPFITEHLLNNLFGHDSEKIKESFLQKTDNARYQLKPEFDTQQKISNHFAGLEEHKKWCEKLLTLCNQVLFVKDPKHQGFFHPRILGMNTECYKHLNHFQKQCYEKLYVDFFYVRNVEFWKRKALEKLPALVGCTKMLVCGEDLGMIPSCVPDVMHQLGILSLEIQRMPKAQGILFENLNAIPYQSVCTTSTHDMNPIRAWWLENRDNTQQYYQQILWKNGKAPEDCTPEISEQIILNHLASPALWVILPWQDWMSIDGNLRNPDPKTERINIPANPDHYWRYRMHLSLEQLLKEKDFNEKVKSMMQNAGR